MKPAVGGPYALTRNPLYLGTYMMALGTTLAIEAWPLAVGLTVLYYAIYHYIILEEEMKLIELFGKPYARYLETVPRFFPRPFPSRKFLEARSEINPDPETWKFSHPLAHKNKAFEAYASFAGLIGFVAMIAYAWDRFGG
jgi:hypothetical protein